MPRYASGRLTAGELRKAIEHAQDHHHVVIDFHTEYDGEPTTRTGSAESVMLMPGIGEVLISATQEAR